ncbi:hypothetical protein Poli38472_003633 [Pythium oligandrum]|uniref:Poly(A) RNA polymerase mitochondrial-like central palm domain-containing protein n=1 Tax=Pythium oligandrum TaxID=41045 RepID=A0A8K1CMZ5_PYTOL|nr:hypothetical protein Poli38472_003633 [Pythium oligandrum]|eukprot:TMW65868.1 hypothetical protein Poli38472_003633 [Pythium oligandrum]
MRRAASDARAVTPLRGRTRLQASSTASRETQVLIDALGEFLLFLQAELQVKKSKLARRRVGTEADRETKTRVLEWLRGLNEREWLSVCTIVEPSFVKTVLAMAMAAKTRPTRGTGVLTPTCLAQFQLLPAEVARKIATATASTAPREFLRRPTTRTADGDALTGFQSSSFLACCEALTGAIRMSNTQRSCDTLSLSTVDISRHDVLRWFEVISGGGFLAKEPADHSKTSHLWREANWFVSRGYVTVPELIVNQIEQNVWFQWNQMHKQPIYQVPLEGVASKYSLAEEWRLASHEERRSACGRIASQVAAYLKQTRQLIAGGSSRFEGGVKLQLVTFMEMLDSKKSVRSDNEHHDIAVILIDGVLSIPFDQVITSPQSAAVSLLIAELVQEECSKLLSEHLVKAEGDSETRSLDDQPRRRHAQKRRSARKKALKQRKQEQGSREVHQRLLKTVLDEYLRAIRQREAANYRIVQDVMSNLVDTVVAEAERQTESTSVNDAAPYRPKRRKKRGKKKKNRQLDDVEDMDPGAMYEEDMVESYSKENHTNNSDVYLGNHRDIVKMPTEVDARSDALARTDSRPLLGFLAAADKSYSSPRPASFGAHAFYSMTPSPLFLQLSSRDPAAKRDDEEYDDFKSSGSGSSGQNGAPADANFDWYLPSLFSSQSSVHTTSTASSLDWDFQHWSLKNDASAKQRINRTINALNPAPTSTEQSPEAFGLSPFSKLLAADSADEKKEETESSSTVAVKGDGSDDGLGGRNSRSDFLYREGGFFDRQRASKRRRRPFPFEFDEENEGEDRDSWEDDRLSYSEQGRSSVKSVKSSDGRSRRASSVDCAASTVEVQVAEGDQAKMAERLSKLEALLEERTMKFDAASTTMSAEINGLQQKVLVLNGRVRDLEEEVQELKRAQEVLLDKSSSSNVAVSTSQEILEHVADPHQHAAPTSASLHYPHPGMAPVAQSNSVLGPFVSVPMSVLPPRSKLHWDMCEFVSQLQTESNARLSAQMAAIRLCTAAVQSLWPRAQVRPYGSFVTRLALPTSDVDLVICLPKVRRDAPADAAGVLEGRNAIKESWQQNLARKLRQEPWVQPDSVKTIPHAAIPIITLITSSPYSVRLDISFEGPGHNGLATNDVVLSLIHEFPALAPIMLVLKSFVIERGFAVAYSGGLSSYALLLMVARYLQEHTDRMPGGYDANGGGIQSCADFGMVLMGLLDFYGNRFDPRTTGISVATRCFLDRETMVIPANPRDHLAHHAMHVVDDSEHWQMNPSSVMHNGNLLSSPGSRRYGNRTALNDWPQRLQSVDQPHDPHKFDPLYIEDPLWPSNNVGRNCFRILQIRRAFAAGYATLMAASMSSSILAENRSTLIGGVPLHPDNILRAILGGQAPANKSDGHGVHNNGSRGPDTAHQVRTIRAPRASNGRAPSVYDNGAPPYFDDNSVPMPPYMLHRMQQQYQQQAQATARSTSTRAYRTDSMSYRRHSESVTEQMTTRSEVASADKYYRRKKERIVSPRLGVQRSSTGCSAQEREDFNRMTRKCPSRSMSFADVVITGSSKTDHRGKAPASPLALMRPSRQWRDDTAIDDTINERLETRDDFELK